MNTEAKKWIIALFLSVLVFGMAYKTLYLDLKNQPVDSKVDADVASLIERLENEDQYDPRRERPTVTMDPAVRRTTEPVAKSTDPVELFRETARSELEIEHSIGNTDRTMKYDVRKTNSAVNPLVGIVWIYDGASNCVMKNTFHYNDSLAMWSRVSSENPHHDAALKRANEFIERHRREERRRLGIPDLGF